MPFGQGARVLDVIETDVVRGKRHPGTVWFTHGVGNTFGLSRKESRTTEYAISRIHPVVDTEVVGRVLGQHHDAAYAGG